MSNNDNGRLRVALLLDSFTQPRWVHRVVREVVESGFAEIALIIKKGSAGSGIRHYLRKLAGNGDSLLWAVYSKLDSRSLSPYPDPFESADITPLTSQCPILRVRQIQEDREDVLRHSDVAELRGHDLDVVLDLSKRPIRGEVLDVPRYGVWVGGVARNAIPREGPPGFWEVMGQEVTTEFALRIAAPNTDQEKVLYRSWTSTDLFSVKGNRSKLYWKSAISVVRKLRDLHDRGPAALEEERVTPHFRAYSGPKCSNPSNAQMLAFLVKVGGRRLQRKLWNSVHLEQWFLAYKLGESERPTDTFFDLKYMKPPKDRFWADPFPIERGGKYFIFMEEFIYRNMKAHISVIEMEQDGNWSKPEKVLETDYHLSYPFIFEWDGNMYMIPETKRNNTIELYRCAEFPLKWEFDRVLISNVEAVDTTLHEMEGLWWLFCNIGGRDFSSNDELHLFHAETPFGPWTPHKLNPVKSDVRSARPAGRLFYWQGHLYRPSQDCSIRMGGAICMNRVTCLTQEDYREELVAHIEPKWTKGIHGTHTINSAGKLTMMDCFRYVRK